MTKHRLELINYLTNYIDRRHAIDYVLNKFVPDELLHPLMIRSFDKLKLLTYKSYPPFKFSLYYYAYSSLILTLNSL